MFRDFVQQSKVERDDTIGALFAGIVLMALPLIQPMLGMSEPVEPVFAILFIFGIGMVLYGSAVLPIYRRLRPVDGRPGSGDDDA